MFFRIGALIFYCVFVSGLPDDDDDIKDRLCMLYCTGIEYTCINGSGHCAKGFIPNYYQHICAKCPGLGDKCWGTCCSDTINEDLRCWQGTCRNCYDSSGNWICRENIDQLLLISSTQIVMAAALIIAILATFVVLYKLCAVPTVSPQDHNYRNRLSIGSLQIYVEERLRDAPPRYSRSPPIMTASSTVTASQSAPSFINAGFVIDGSTSPPPYTPKPEESTTTQNTALHM